MNTDRYRNGVVEKQTDLEDGIRHMPSDDFVDFVDRYEGRDTA